VITKRGDRSAIPVLFEEAQGTNAAVVKAAFQALGKLATETNVPALLTALVSLQTPQARTEAEAALVQILSTTAQPTAHASALGLAFDTAKDNETRRSLLQLFPYAPTDQTFSRLIAVTDDAQSPLQDAAIRSLAEWPNMMAWGYLMPIYRQSENAAHRVLALRALVRLAAENNSRPNHGLIQNYRQLLDRAKKDEDRKMILSALSAVEHPEALKLVLPLLDNPQIRAEVELAVKKMANALKTEHPQAAQEALEKLRNSTN
jgi:HEAT repeat protein